MKKGILIVIVIGALGWAIFDFVSSSDDSAEEDVVVSDDSTSSEPPAGVEDIDESDDEVGLETGDIPPDFEVTTLAGDTVQLSDFRGERVMLNFWATWCPPCRAEMPDMQKLYEEEDVVILAVNMTDTESNVDEVADFMDELELTFPVPMDEEAEIMDAYQIIAYPTSFMIDSNGRIQSVSLGALNHEQMLQQLEAME